jgi:hypothetical protein
VQKWAHELNRQFSKEEVQLINKYIKNCSPSLPIKKYKSARCQWVTPVILATQEAEIRRITF